MSELEDLRRKYDDLMARHLRLKQTNADADKLLELREKCAKLEHGRATSYGHREKYEKADRNLINSLAAALSCKLNGKAKE